MRAADLVVEYPTVALSSPAIDAARLLARADLPGLIVVDDAGRPYAVPPTADHGGHLRSVLYVRFF